MKNEVTPEITLILPIFNGEHYLDQCLKSIELQNFKGFELIIVNDGSTDSSLKIVQQFANDKSYVTIVQHHTNQGLPAALNSGIKIARGFYQSWISADDVIGSDYLANMLHYIRDGAYDFVYSDYFLIDLNGDTIGESSVELVDSLICGNVIGPSRIYTSKLVANLQGYDEDSFMFEDYVFNVRAWESGAKFRRVERQEFFYRWHLRQLTHSRAMPDRYFYFRRKLIEKHLKSVNLDIGRAIVSFIKAALERRKYRVAFFSFLFLVPRRPVAAITYIVKKSFLLLQSRDKLPIKMLRIER